MTKMKKKLHQILIIILSFAIVVSMLSGCGKKKETAEIDTSVSKYGNEYPIKSDTVLTYWMPMSAVISENAANYGDLPIAKELEKRTGIKVDYVHPALRNMNEQFNLMLASGQLTDIIEYPWSYYPGGPQVAIDNDIILPLNDMIDAWAPDFKKTIQTDVNANEEAKTDKGYYFSVGTVAIDPKLNTVAGPIIRYDWLKDLNLEIPETIDEWEVVLKAFKEKKRATASLGIGTEAIVNGAFIGAYGVNYEFYLDNGKVKFGPAEPGYKDFLSTMKKWYDMGILDPNFSTSDAATIKANMLNGVSGATWQALGGGIGVYTNDKKDPNAIYGAAPYPTLKKGDISKFGNVSSPFMSKAAISVKCKDPELAMKFLNYGYTEEGHMLYNFGIEGKSYEMVEKDGKMYPQYTKLITENPDGLSMQQALALYSHAGYPGNFEQDIRYLEQYAGLEIQREAWEMWRNTDGFKTRVPETGVAEEDSTEYLIMYDDITAHRNEMYVKFIMGARPLSEYDAYVKELEDMGLSRLLEIKQNAYNSFINR